MLTGQVILGEDDYDTEAQKVGMLPEHLALGRTIELFGPVTPNFLRHTNDKGWEEVLSPLQDMVTGSAGKVPAERFENWALEDFLRFTPSSKELLSKMLKCDPAERVTMSQTMNDPCWGQAFETESQAGLSVDNSVEVQGARKAPVEVYAGTRRENRRGRRGGLRCDWEVAKTYEKVIHDRTRDMSLHSLTLLREARGT